MNNTNKENPSNQNKPQSKKGVRVYREAPPYRERVKGQVQWSWREIMDNTLKEVWRN